MLTHSRSGRAYKPTIPGTRSSSCVAVSQDSTLQTTTNSTTDPDGWTTVSRHKRLQPSLPYSQPSVQRRHLPFPEPVPSTGNSTPDDTVYCLYPPPLTNKEISVKRALELGEASTIATIALEMKEDQ